MSHFRKADEERMHKILDIRPELNFLRVKVGTPIVEAMERILSLPMELA